MDPSVSPVPCENFLYGFKAARRTAVDGIVVAEVRGKEHPLLLPVAILSLLGIPCFLIFDGDKGCAARMRRDGKKEPAVSEARNDHSRKNRNLLRYLGESEEDWPASRATDGCAIFEDRMESEPGIVWPQWEQRRRDLIDSGTGYHSKNTATYRHAAATAPGMVPEIFQEILQAAPQVPN